jgi:POT family proton-dependent oligopeptide transporter
VYLLFAGAKEGMVHLGRMVALLLLLALNAVFWACFEQAGNSMNLFAERNVALGDFGFAMKAADTQAFNALFIILLAPLFAALWIRLDRRGWNPWVPVKFALGIVQVGLGFGVLVLASKYLGDNGIVPLWTLALCYLVHTTGELCISPVGLSTMTRLAPARLSGLVMGGWFLSTAYGNFLAGQISKLAGRSGDVNTGDLPAVQSLPVYADVFWMLTQVGVFIGLGALVLSPLVQRLMKDVK